MKPLQLAVYKGMGGKNGALQLGYQPPHFFVKDEKIIKEYGTIKNYDGRYIPDFWKNKYPNADITIDHLTSREGAIFLEATSAIGKNVYDWPNKITMALSVTDMGKLLMLFEGAQSELTIMHDPGAKSASSGKVQKYLNISSPKGIKVGAIVNISEKKADGKLTKHMIPLSGDEVKMIGICLRAAIPAALAWV